MSVNVYLQEGKLKITSLQKFAVSAVALTVGWFCWPAGAQATNNSESAPTLAPAHGTVNIIIANPNGLVAITDSRLSNHGRPVGEGQKLFQLDERTICTIAGWYRDPGPISPAQVPMFFNDIPRMIGFYKVAGIPPTTSLRDKLKFLSRKILFTLELEAQVETASHSKLAMSKLELTLAGYEDGHPMIVYSDFEPSVEAKQRYFQGPIYVKLVEDNLVYLVRGIENAAKPILDMDPGVNQNDGVIGRYRAAMAESHGISLSIDDMSELAKELEGRSHALNPAEIGGNIQFAVLSHGKVLKFEQPVEYDGSRIRQMTEVPGFKVDLGEHPESWALTGPTTGGISSMGSISTYAHEVTERHALQSLDNFYFQASKFDWCILEYEESPVTMFDNSNIVTNSMLFLLPGSNLDDAFVRQFRTDFPDVPVVDKRDGSFTTRLKIVN